ncbi:hypothetical protein TNCV_2992561 [Trichonephila clavipes]|nr:hypothetical protein TNCV_2992561 [Trichonephila clavipes]
MGSLMRLDTTLRNDRYVKLQQLIAHLLSPLAVGSIIFGVTESNSNTENNLLKSCKTKNVARELTSAEGLASTKKIMSNGGRREGVRTKRRATASASKRNASCICRVSGDSYYNENEELEWVPYCATCSS